MNDKKETKRGIYFVMLKKPRPTKMNTRRLHDPTRYLFNFMFSIIVFVYI